MLNLESLNEAQRKAVTHGNGPLLVLAGPGSGKTYTITQRIFYLIERLRISPEKILVITFTKDAALSMQSRFLQLSKQTLPVNFGTFHSVFYHILRESHILQTNQILTLSQKKKIIFPILIPYLFTDNITDRQNRNFESRKKQNRINQNSNCLKEVKQSDLKQIDVHDDLSEIALNFLTAISYYKNTGDTERAAEKLSGEWQNRFEEVLRAYERERTRIGVIDFDDMVYGCRELLEQNCKLRRYWQERFDAILIDEFQDISPMQYEVVRLLAGEQNNIFAVGDDDQSIYGFRGANPECLKRFVREYHAEQICLNINYRSQPEIVRAANLVIAENKERFPKELYALQEWQDRCANASDLEQKCGIDREKEKSKVVRLRAFCEREDQYQYLVEQLKSVITVKKVSVGVLFRTNTFMQGFAARLHREGIPYTMREKAVSIYEHFLVKDIMAYLRLARGEKTRALFLQIMNKPSRYISREALGEEPDYENLIQYYRKNYAEGINAGVRTNDKTEQNDMEWKSMAGKYTRSQGVIQTVEKWKKQMQYLSGLSPFAAVSYIRKAIGYESYLRERAGRDTDKWQEWQEILEWLTTDATHYDTVEEWLEAQEDYAKALEEGKGELRHTQNQPIINLMTAHASKGLEFDAVYVPDCNEKIFPYGKMLAKESCEEERRVFYVAMTRAKKSLELLYLTGTKERPRLPSRFLNRLM